LPRATGGWRWTLGRSSSPFGGRCGLGAGGVHPRRPKVFSGFPVFGGNPKGGPRPPSGTRQQGTPRAGTSAQDGDQEIVRKEQPAPGRGRWTRGVLDARIGARTATGGLRTPRPDAAPGRAQRPTHLQGGEPAPGWMADGCVRPRTPWDSQLGGAVCPDHRSRSRGVGQLGLGPRKPRPPRPGWPTTMGAENIYGSRGCRKPALRWAFQVSARSRGALGGGGAVLDWRAQRPVSDRRHLLGEAAQLVGQSWAVAPVEQSRAVSEGGNGRGGLVVEQGDAQVETVAPGLQGRAGASGGVPSFGQAAGPAGRVLGSAL